MSEIRAPGLDKATVYDGIDPDIEAAAQSGQVDAWFQYLEAQEWIDANRIVSNGKLDIDRSALELAIPFMYAPLRNRGRLIGYPGLGRWALQVSDQYGAADQRVTFGHESGHLFLVPVRKNVLCSMGYSDEEAFCEQFGRSMAMPLSELEEIGDVSQATIAELMEWYGVDVYTVMIQLMLARKLPRTFAADSMDDEQSNPYYSNKVNRCVICLDCELRKPHEPIAHEDLSVYNFTENAWASSLDMPFHSLSVCETEPDHDKFRELNISYGHWREEDEIRHEKEKALFEKAVHSSGQTAGNPKGYEWVLRCDAAD